MLSLFKSSTPMGCGQLVQGPKNHNGGTRTQMSIGNDLKRGLRDLERQSGQHTVTTKTGLELPCVGNTAESSKALGMGGFQLEADLSVFVRVEVMPTQENFAAAGIAEKQKLTYSGNGRVYRIDQIRLLPGDSVYKFTCVDLNKGV